jgi:hypothetical protein
MAQYTEPDTRSKSLTREPSGLTLLRGRKPATKTLGLNADGILDVIESYHNQSKFKYSHCDTPDILALFTVLETASQDPNTFVIRGALRDHVNANKNVYRRNNVSHGDLAHFEECPRSWVMIDLDKVPLDDIDLVNDPVGTVKRAIKKFLPKCYQNASFVWQLSSSAGLKDDGFLSTHIWFILDRPMGEAELKTLHALKAPDVDRSLFQTVQIHYVAAPIFEDGVKDHLPVRIGLVELKEGEVSLPELPPEVITSAHRTIGKGTTGSVHGFENKLKLMGDGEGLDGFHAVLIAAVASYVYGKFEFEIDIKWLKTQLREAIIKAPKRPGREKDIARYLSDASLDNDIGTAISKFCQTVTTPKYPAPMMTPDHARSEIKSNMKKAADQHFTTLAEWELINKPYQEMFKAKLIKIEATATANSEIYDLREFTRRAHKECKDDGFERPKSIPKAVWSLAVGVGLGKTEQALKLMEQVRDRAQALLAADKQADDITKLSDETRIAYKRLTRAVLAVPTHKLANEADERAQKAGLSAGVFRGRLYQDPDTEEHVMCNRADDVQLCIDAGLPVASSMCKSRGFECKFRHSCGYFAQMNTLEDCGVVVVPHASMFHEKPPINSRGLLIIDEQFAFDGVRQRRSLKVSELRKNNDKVYVKNSHGKRVVDKARTKKLHHYREAAAKGVIKNASGNLSGRSMMSLNAADVAEAIKLEFQTVVHFPVYPGMSRKRLIKALASAVAIKKMRLRVDFWKALLTLVSSDWEQKSGWLIRDTNDDGDVVVDVGGRATIKDGWFDGLAICLDATSARELVQLYFPKHEVIAPPAIEAVQANVTVLQTTDKAFSASMCIPTDGLEADELQRRENRAREVYRFILLRASEFRNHGADGIDVLVICQQALEKHLIELGLPDNVEIAHFNATRGIDRWGGVRCLITIGRTLPSPSDVEVLAENLSGWVVDKVSGKQWYPRQSAGLDVGGIGLTVQSEQHPDEMVEAVRWQICEAELIQVAGRGRGVNRLPNNPLQLDLLSNVCLPMTVDQPVRWDDNAPGRIEEMVGLGLLPDGPAAAALIYPELWPTVKTAKMAANSSRAKGPKEQLNGLKSLLYIFNRDLRPFSEKRTNFHLLGPIEALVKTWGLKPLAFGALSRMRYAQAKIKRHDKRALKVKFMFDPHLISNPEIWLSDCTGLEVEVEYLSPAQDAPTHRAKQDQPKMNSGFDAKAKAPVA